MVAGKLFHSFWEKNKAFVLGGYSNAYIYMYMYICMYFLFFFYNSDLTVKNHTEQQVIHF